VRIQHQHHRGRLRALVDQFITHAKFHLIILPLKKS
jgi:hypothetical protein